MNQATVKHAEIEALLGFSSKKKLDNFTLNMQCIQMMDFCQSQLLGCIGSAFAFCLAWLQHRILKINS